ncbi:MAG: hypothetical protein MUF04_10650 [Akkermansiaceae bacterium]|jgi:hypothetical protein|nr:hypothetical protein [Akkermansiaceae bacterium]
MPTAAFNGSALQSAGEALWKDLLAASGGESGAFAPCLPAGIDLGAELAQPDSATLAEVVQHLRDLGYLERPAAGGARLRPGDAPLLERALTNYRADEASFGRCFAIRLVRGWALSPPDPSTPPPSHPLVVLPETVLRLRALTSLDGVLRIRSLPNQGEAGLAGRVIHHLLAHYGFLPDSFPPESPYGPATASALRGLAALVGFSPAEFSAVGLINLLLDLDAMADRLASQGKTWDLDLPAPVAGDWWDSIQWQRNKVGRFRKAVARACGGVNVVWDFNDRQVFGVRFLQIFLWHRGHYFGEVDGEWGPQSDAALRLAAMVHAPAPPGGSDPVASFMTEGGGTLRIRFSHFVRCCRKTDGYSGRPRAMRGVADPGDDLAQLQKAIRERLEEIGGWHRVAPETIDEKEAEAWNRLYNEVDSNAAARTLDTARRNYSMSMIGRSVAWLIGKLREVVGKVKETVKTFAKRVAAFVGELVARIREAALPAFRFLQRGLAGAIRVATQAGTRLLRMINGTPFTTHMADRWITTRFSFDQDAVTIGSRNLKPEDLAAHFGRIAAENRSLETAIRLGVKVLLIAVQCTPPVIGLTAIRLALAIFRALCEVPKALPQKAPATRGLRGMKPFPHPPAPPSWPHPLLLTA